MVFISGSRFLGYSGSRVLKFSSSCVLGLLGSRALKFWGTLLFFKIKLQQDNNKKIWKKVKKKIGFFFLGYFTWPGLPENTRNIQISGQGGSGLAHFMVRFFRFRILNTRKSGVRQDIRFFRFFAHVSYSACWEPRRVCDNSVANSSFIWSL